MSSRRMQVFTMAKTPCLMTAIPLDIVSIILDNLELSDVKSTRLTCKYLSAIGPRFRSFVVQQTTDLDVDSLQRQQELASHPQLRSAVTKLVVMAAVFDTSELVRMLKTKTRQIVDFKGPFTTVSELALTNDELLQAASDLEWMHAQQSRQKIQKLPEIIDALATVLRLYGALDTIDLNACVTKGPRLRVSTAQAGEWHPVFIRASEVYQITTSAIALSGLSLNTLLVYRATPSCSVPSFDVTSHIAKLEALPSFASAFSSLENFALSFSTRVKTDSSMIESARDEIQGDDAADDDSSDSMSYDIGHYSHENPEATVEDNFPGVARMLHWMPKLDAFDLHMTDTLDGSSSMYQKIFEYIGNEVKLPLLTKVLLRGLPASEESLLKFFDNHQSISDLTIDEMKLSSGSWKRVIGHISQLPDLSNLRLSNLFDEGGVFNLLSKTTGDDRQPYETPENSYHCARGVKVHTRTFGSADIQLLRTGLEFDDTDIGRSLGSPQVMRWAQLRRFRYSL
ncbi:hypothetical protein BKA65DRAFT_510349 [Rhexocercosporidium sp. MPI-PUGE-AT-0058]|nr:hypothetical protein BKA65DRAFT_510349 [Rhexocercosporidium sp. MPI-PUGE-AT-0058]